MIYSKKQLEIVLSKLKPLTTPKINLEQYPTPSNIAAEVVWLAYMNNDIKNKIVADLGCGNGILGIGALLLGAKKVFFVDTDSDAILTTKKNLENQRNAILLHQEVSIFNEHADTIIQNPPFGVQNEHADRIFLIKAMQISKKIYSFHKRESEQFIQALIKDYNFQQEQVLQFSLPLKKTQDFHTKKEYKVQVGCFILSKKAKQNL